MLARKTAHEYAKSEVKSWIETHGPKGGMRPALG